MRSKFYASLWFSYFCFIKNISIWASYVAVLHITKPTLIKFIEIRQVVPAHTSHELGPLASSELELTSEIMNPFRHFCRNPWNWNYPIANILSAQDSTTQIKEDIYPSVERDSNTSQSSSSPRPNAPWIARPLGPAIHPVVLQIT
jgi:hypothetical protein